MRTKPRLLAILAWMALVLPALPAAADEEAKPALELGGRYRVSGATLDRNGLERQIDGIVSIHQEGDRFTSHSELKTTDPASPSSPAEVIGTGEGTIRGNRLEGEGDLQLVSSEVPGLGVEFGLAPIATTSVRIFSTWKATVEEDGSITIETSNKPAEGEDEYLESKTTLTGKRIAEEVSRAE